MRLVAQEVAACVVAQDVCGVQSLRLALSRGTLRLANYRNYF
jgi:hypothetical protein